MPAIRGGVGGYVTSANATSILLNAANEQPDRVMKALKKENCKTLFDFHAKMGIPVAAAAAHKASAVPSFLPSGGTPGMQTPELSSCEVPSDGTILAMQATIGELRTQVATLQEQLADAREQGRKEFERGIRFERGEKLSRKRKRARDRSDSGSGED